MSTSSQTWVVRSPDDLARALSGARRARGLTQGELAAELGLGRSYLAELESGAASPMVIERVLRALRRLGATVTITLPASTAETDADAQG
ncbi:MAG: helix-turn-helix domain-containing protein [Solirubrobacteraceae bacterium]|nr:helix-turn-helix domain-containing protein [Solirubrobacteraceae bacterium]